MFKTWNLHDYSCQLTRFNFIEARLASWGQLCSSSPLMLTSSSCRCQMLELCLQTVVDGSNHLTGPKIWQCNTKFICMSHIESYLCSTVLSLAILNTTWTSTSSWTQALQSTVNNAYPVMLSELKEASWYRDSSPSKAGIRFRNLSQNFCPAFIQSFWSCIKFLVS